MLNKIVIAGRLTKDVELRHTNTGKSVASITLAVERDFEKGAVDFIDVVLWGNSAEFASKYFSKGRVAIVSGRLQLRDWTDNNGNKRRNAEVVADAIYFGDSKREEPRSESYDSDLRAPKAPAFEPYEDDEDLPF